MAENSSLPFPGGGLAPIPGPSFSPSASSSASSSGRASSGNTGGINFNPSKSYDMKTLLIIGAIVIVGIVVYAKVGR